MSLSVNIKRFKTIKVKLPKYARVEFRNVPKFSSLCSQTDEYLEVNECFRWSLGNKPLNPGETLVVYLISRTIFNTEKVMGVYRLGLQILATDRSLEITDALVSDANNQSTQVFVEMQVFYDPAGELPGTAERKAGFVNKIPITANPSVHRIGDAKKPPGKQAMNLPAANTQQLTSSYDLASRQGTQRALTAPLQSSSPMERQVTPPESVWEVVYFPTLRQTIPSQTSRQESTSPEAYKQISSSLPSAFHQALRIKYSTKNEKESLPSVHKPSSSRSSQQGSQQLSPRDTVQSSAAQSDGDETDPLIHVERNIATLEKSLKNKETVIDIDSEDDTIPNSRGSKLKQVGKRFFRRNWSFGETDRGIKYVLPSSDLEQKHKSKKASTFRTVKNLIRMGRSRTRDSSGDEEMGLLDVAAGTSAPDITTSQTSMSSVEDAILVDVRSPPDTPKTTKKMHNLR